MTHDTPEPALRRLRDEEREALHEQVSALWAGLADAAGHLPYVQGALYAVVWVLSGLDRAHAERVAWLAQQMRFELDALQVATVPSEVPGVVDTFYQIHLRRPVPLLPDALLGEAQVLAALGVCWDLYLTDIVVPGHDGADHAALRSTYGPMGRDIA